MVHSFHAVHLNVCSSILVLRFSYRTICLLLIWSFNSSKCVLYKVQCYRSVLLGFRNTTTVQIQYHKDNSIFFVLSKQQQNCQFPVQLAGKLKWFAWNFMKLQIFYFATNVCSRIVKIFPHFIYYYFQLYFNCFEIEWTE